MRKPYPSDLSDEQWATFDDGEAKAQVGDAQAPVTRPETDESDAQCQHVSVGPHHGGGNWNELFGSDENSSTRPYAETPYQLAVNGA